MRGHETSQPFQPQSTNAETRPIGKCQRLLRRRRKSPPPPKEFDDLVERPDCNKLETFTKRVLKGFFFLASQALYFVHGDMGMVGIFSDA